MNNPVHCREDRSVNLKHREIRPISKIEMSHRELVEVSQRLTTEAAISARSAEIWARLVRAGTKNAALESCR
jgi:hypothetical protein